MSLQQGACRAEFVQNLVVVQHCSYPVLRVTVLTALFAPQARHDFVQMLQVMHLERDVEIEEVAGPFARHHLQCVDVAALVADDLRHLGQRAHLVEDR